MADYVVDPANPLSPTNSQGAKQGAEEFRALKAYIATLAGLPNAGQLLAREPLNVNPNWLLDQINEGALYTVTGGAATMQGPDGWSGVGLAAPGIFKIRRITNPDYANEKCLEITCTTIDAAIAATDYYQIFTAIEGYDLADRAPGTAQASSITIMFKMKFSKVGVYGVAVRNSATDRSYVTSVTQNVANTWETKSITIPLDVAGVWLYTNGVGLYLSFALAAGANFQTPAALWTAGNFHSVATQVNFMDNVANIGYIGRIHVIPGTIALAYSSQDIEKELAKAQRYYIKSYDLGVIAGTVTTAGAFGCESSWTISSSGYIIGSAVNYSGSMRAIPTLTNYSTTGASGKLRDTTNGADVTPNILATGASGFTYEATIGANNSRETLLGHYTANARLS